ncbi:acyltransferase family protein [Caulobacter sp.]|uniref:acyltransferase family protein n=1 Tax=Caulobacter sp. TaxID=78 RepID=UPI003BA9EECD
MRRLPHLQALRAIAASLVVADHALTALATRGLVGAPAQQAGYFLGWAGVAAFLAISGLIMIRTSAHRFGRPGAALDFAWRRIIRIVPLYWLATAVYFILKSKLGEHYSVAEILKSLLFWPYANPGDVVMRPIVGQGWTLNLEVFFYALFAISLTMPRRLGLPVILASLPALVLAGLAVRPLVPYADPLTPAAFLTDPIMLFFTCGMLLGLVERTISDRIRFDWPLATAIGALGLSAAAFVILDLRFPLQIVWQLALGVFCVGAVAAATLTDRDASWWPQKALVVAGDASFSTYLFHPLAITALNMLPVAGLPRAVHVGGFVVAALIGGNLLGFLVYRLVERPMTEGLRKFTLRPASAAADNPTQR